MRGVGPDALRRQGAQQLAGVLAGTQFLAEFAVAEHPGQRGQDLQVFVGRVLGHYQGEQQVHGLAVRVTGTRPLSQSQLSTGGVPLAEVDPATMESRVVPGLYLAGELLNVIGPCGGYNLHWAWASGAVAGRAAGAESGPAAGV